MDAKHKIAQQQLEKIVTTLAAMNLDAYIQRLRDAWAKSGKPETLRSGRPLEAELAIAESLRSFRAEVWAIAHRFGSDIFKEVRLHDE